jgi:hypothetical protein
MTKLEIQKMKAEATNCERIVATLEDADSMRQPLITRAENLKAQIKKAEKES